MLCCGRTRNTVHMDAAGPATLLNDTPDRTSTKTEISAVPDTNLVSCTPQTAQFFDSEGPGPAVEQILPSVKDRPSIYYKLTHNQQVYENLGRSKKNNLLLLLQKVMQRSWC